MSLGVKFSRVEPGEASTSVPLQLKRDDLVGYSYGIVIKLDPRLRGDDSGKFLA